MDEIARGTDEICTQIAEAAGLEVKNLKGFELKFYPNSLIEVEATYFVPRIHLDQIKTILESRDYKMISKLTNWENPVT